jgi:hypothetical protein
MGEDKEGKMVGREANGKEWRGKNNLGLYE